MDVYYLIHQFIEHFRRKKTFINFFPEELRGFESRSCRLQSSLDRVQSDRLVFLKNVGSIINVSEPCESLIKDKVREIMNENQTMCNVSRCDLCELGSFYNNPLISLCTFPFVLSKFITCESN